MMLEKNNIDCLQDVIAEYAEQTSEIDFGIRMNSITNKVISENYGVTHGYIQRFISYSGQHEIIIDNEVPDGYVEIKVSI